MSTHPNRNKYVNTSKYGYPEFNTCMIECSYNKCKWTGCESELKTIEGFSKKIRVCPDCECKSYRFLKNKSKD